MLFSRFILRDIYELKDVLCINNIINTLKDKFRLVIRDRKASANILASGIINNLSTDEKKNVLVLGIPRGGIIVADTIATKLNTDILEIVIPRRLLAPNNKEIAFGAIMEDGSEYLDHRMINSLVIPSDYIEQEKIKQKYEMERLSLLYRNSKYLMEYSIKIKNADKTIILTDDGAATGSTLICVSRWLKNRNEHKFKKLVIAVPIAPKKTANLLKEECDHLEVIFQPSNFQTVSQYYKEFLPLTDKHVFDVISRWNNTPK
jgi:predicted phosphoribosyltransferase